MKQIHNELKNIGITFATDGILMTASHRNNTSLNVIKDHIHNSINRRITEISKLEELLTEVEYRILEDEDDLEYAIECTETV